MIVEMTEIREELQIDPRTDARVERKLKAVIGKLERLTNRRLEYTVGFVQTWRPDVRSPRLWSKLYPLVSVALTQWSSADTIAGAVDIAPEAYQTNLETGEIILTGPDTTGVIAPVGWGFSGFNDGLLTNGRYGWAENVQATMTGGYTNLTVPPEVKEAIITQLKYEIARNSPTKIDVRTMSQNRSSTAFIEGDLHPEFHRLAKNMRLRTYGAS